MGIFFKLNFPSKSVAVATELFSICTVAPIIASPLFLSLTSPVINLPAEAVIPNA